MPQWRSKLIARRLAAGRTSANYWLLMETSLLSCAQEPTATLPAVRGLTASWQGTDVWILDSFTRRGCAKNDVAELRPAKAGEWVLGQVTTCSTSDLKLVRLQHEVVELKRGRVVLRELQPCADPVHAVHSIREKADAAADAVAPSEPAFLSLRTEAINCHAVKPEGALAHEKMHPTHAVQPRSDRKRYELCLDVPHVQVWDMTPWRCRNCESETWHITSSDIDAECTRLGIGRVILRTDPRHGKLHATPMMLFWLLLIFYSKMNLRAVQKLVGPLFRHSAACFAGLSFPGGRCPAAVDSHVPSRPPSNQKLVAAVFCWLCAEKGRHHAAPAICVQRADHPR